MRKLNLSKIRQEMESRGWSMSELARRTGLSSPGVLKLLRGDNNPKLSTALSIAEALEMELVDLLEADPTEEEPAHQLALAM